MTTKMGLLKIKLNKILNPPPPLKKKSLNTLKSNERLNEIEKRKAKMGSLTLISYI
jgi:hypothetical protein